MDKLVPVSKEEFDAFIASYPRKLDFDVFGACEPPLATYNDFTLGNWPESVVAAYSRFDASEPYYKDCKPNWRILRAADSASPEQS